MDRTTLEEKATAFKGLHESDGTFVMPCAWDVFSALLFERAGFQCVGTTSGGVNWVHGRKDYLYTTPFIEMLRVYGDIANGTNLPVSADLENGYGETPEQVAATISSSIAAGLVGGSIEDQRIVPSDGNFNDGVLYEIDDAVARLKAARVSADKSEISYTLTARCEVYYSSCTTPFTVAVERLNAYWEAGADCLFVPGLNDPAALKQLVKEVNGPVSFGMGASDIPLSVSMLKDIGVRRISTGGGLTRAMFGSLQRAVSEIKDSGSFTYLDGALSETQIVKFLDGE